jgi:hypothetical protein
VALPPHRVDRSGVTCHASNQRLIDIDAADAVQSGPAMRPRHSIPGRRRRARVAHAKRHDAVEPTRDLARCSGRRGGRNRNRLAGSYANAGVTSFGLRCVGRVRRTNRSPVTRTGPFRPSIALNDVREFVSHEVVARDSVARQLTVGENNVVTHGKSRRANLRRGFMRGGAVVNAHIGKIV